MPLNSVLIRSPVSEIEFAASREGSFTGFRGRYSSVSWSSVRISDSPSAPLDALVEPLAGLLAEKALGQHLLDEGRQHEAGTRLPVRQPLVQVADHVDEDVDAGQIERAERRALRAANGRPGHRVDLFDRVSASRDEREQMHHASEREMVADEVRRVLRNHHSLAQVVIGERAHLVDDLPARLSRSE